MEDPLGISSYMRNRLLELIGPELLGTAELERPRAAEPIGAGGFYINPDVEYAFPYPEYELISPKGPTATTSASTAKGHRPIAGGATEILETPNTRPARPPRRLFRVDVTESEAEYILRADLAGMSKENVRIDVLEDQSTVTIAVEPPKNEFFGLYKSPLESRTEIIKEAETEEDKSEETRKEMPEKEICHLVERCVGPMARSIKMPYAVDMSAINATMKEGLLLIKFAKKKQTTEESKKKVIEIQ